MKNKFIKKALCLLMTLSLILTMTCCSKAPVETETELETESDDIFILFTNDVHCRINEEIGYDGLAAYKKGLSENHKYVTLVDCGDHIQGSYVGSVTKGEYIVEIMNEVGYDFAAFGNHEFDFCADRLAELTKIADYKYLCCDIRYSGKGENLFKDIKPCAIKEYSDTKVAFIGITTPCTIIDSAVYRFSEDGECVYDFYYGNDGKDFYAQVQNAADLAKADGADFVVALSHVGYDESIVPYDVCSLAENTSGIDVFLDAHSHTELPCLVMKNSEGEEVLVSSTGTQLGNIDQLVITSSGNIFVGYISDYSEKDADTTALIDKINAAFNDKLGEVVGSTNTKLGCFDESGIRMVRNRETTMGDFVADAFRTVSGADIGICNGSGIRADLEVGDVTYESIIAVLPFENVLSSIEMTGQEILDYLEYVYSSTQSEYEKDGNAVGENGSFMQISGMKLTINTGIPTSIEVDESDNIVSVCDTRRVSDVIVLKDGEYVPIDPEETYTVAALDYVIRNGGSGTTVILGDNQSTAEDITTDYQTLINYLETLGGDTSQYSEPQGRITIK